MAAGSRSKGEMLITSGFYPKHFIKLTGRGKQELIIALGRASVREQELVRKLCQILWVLYRLEMSCPEQAFSGRTC